MFPSVHGVAASGTTPAADAWYLAGGAPAPVAAYQPIGAASLAASYVNLVNPGTFDAAPPATPPTLVAGGWDMSLTELSGMQLVPDFVLQADQSQSLIFRYSAMALIDTNRYVGGAGDTAPSLSILPRRSGGDTRWYNGAAVAEATDGLSFGVLAIAGNTAYRNGSPIGTAAATGLPFTRTMTVRGNWVIVIAAVAIYDTSTDHATWMPAVMTAAAAL